ncbi:MULTISPECIES: ATP-binding cassette domain-containing protein [Bacillus]|uniref:ABC transporter ATP-binding protein n=1 Tax=Bacillus TaxID=1386 RepID=UPI000D03DFB5|nr:MULTISPECIES: ABC transporter ATP-binding protein [Bacillus]MCP1527740.1 ABC-2 type transport system ATP-binding protein [Bacillus pumilus]MCY7500387.1 ABC transporter ATP-binding protein [Bacillus pumilus]MCY7527060.1 ABC transporter ATP-binding protein [Bacillus pumilus]MDF9786906.1 ABC-2 type transport system ATP-binding protein [Bacillus pumilus]MED4440793.1 ABC transporter ATP-binding protein [Bacillus pumilus]
MYALKTTNLTKRYGNKIVVDKMNLSIDKGTIFGFLGKNGAGKSTFINMITGIIEPTEGLYEVLGYKKNQQKSIWGKIGVLPDYSTFYENMTALDHLKYFSQILKLDLKQEDLIELLDKVELKDAAKLKTKNFSFGMKKKLGIAQALLNKPDLIFLDEPTSGVDANSVLNIHSIIKEIATNGTTVFLTSHNLDEVEKLCDEVAIMNKGVIQIKGSMKELRTAYKKNMTVYIKHSVASIAQIESLTVDLKSISIKSEISELSSQITIEDESSIPLINKLFISKNIDVFRIEVDEPSLEEIFLNIGDNN